MTLKGPRSAWPGSLQPLQELHSEIWAQVKQMTTRKFVSLYEVFSFLFASLAFVPLSFKDLLALFCVLFLFQTILGTERAIT